MEIHLPRQHCTISSDFPFVVFIYLFSSPFLLDYSYNSLQRVIRFLPYLAERAFNSITVACQDLILPDIPMELWKCK